MALLCVRLGLNQIVIGIGLTLGAEGLTALLHHFQFSRTYPRLPARRRMSISPACRDIPVIGPALFTHHLRRLPGAAAWSRCWPGSTGARNLGLNLQAAGDKPAALDVAGVDVVRTRSVAVLFTGALAGLGGAYLANVGAGIFVPFMTNGAGFIGIVLAMLARGRPLWVLIGRAALRRLPVADHGAAGRGHQHSDRRHPDAALRGGHADAGDLRPPGEPAGGPRPALRTRRPLSAAGQRESER